MEKESQENLELIADCLWNGRASVFVGAGFSKNANLISGGSLPPNWNQLGDLFFEKTRNHRPNMTELAYASVLRLAEDVENMYGRDALYKLICDAVNDDKLEPSDVHYRLLALPWNNVYTTNYDTLLEKSLTRQGEHKCRQYSVITSDQAIGAASPPILMKLHGDIDDPSSIIITEEDYRTYPSKHPAMINHIQNTIMMETMVLIGFSGNDPNFRQWLGWVRDALRDKQRKIFLLSVEDLSDVDKMAFERKNVIVVDLNGMGGENSTPSKNVSAAISYFDRYIRVRENESEQYRKSALEWGKSSSNEADVEQLYIQWKEEHNTYPGWLIMPREKREYWVNVKGFSLNEGKLSKLDRTKQLLFLDEFNWRIEKCLLPMENRWESVYRSVLDQYNSLTGYSEEIQNACVNLKLGLLRLYRQEGWDGKWQIIHDELDSIREKLSECQRCRFDYEQALNAIYQNDFRLLEEVLNNWEECLSDPYWDIKRGSIWAEYMSLDKGRRITQEAFKAICKKLDASSKESERFYWASRKVHAHAVWNYMASANFSDGSGETVVARQTWSELKSYDNIWYEREFFDANVRSIEEALRVKTKRTSFQLGQYSTTMSLSGNFRDYRMAYAYFLFYEEAGSPIHLPFLTTVVKKTLEKSLSVMGYCSPRIAECWLLRSGDFKLVSAVYNRRFLERTGYDDVNSLYSRCLGCLDTMLKADIGESAPSWTLTYRKVLPEILSRLCMKSSYESRVKTFDYIDEIFKRNDSIHFESMDKLLSSLISSFSKSEISGLIPRLAEMHIAYDRFGDFRLEPFSYVNETCRVSANSVRTIVEDLLGHIGHEEKEDKALIYRLCFLDQCKALSSDQRNRLATILWSRVDDSGFPVGTIFSRFAFLTLPHPADINPETLLKEYILSTNMPVVGSSGNISFYHGTLPILNDIKGTTNDDVHFLWDASLLNAMCANLIKMWDSDKNLLCKDDDHVSLFSYKDELQQRFMDVDSIIANVLYPNLNILTDGNIQCLKRMANEYEDYGMYSLRMKLALFGVEEGEVNVEREIRIRLGALDERAIKDCVKAIIFLSKTGVDVMKWVEVISEYFRSNEHLGRISMISGLEYLLSIKGCLDYANILSNIKIGLKRIFDSTVIQESDDEFYANEKMYLRKIVAPIVCRLWQKESDNGDEVIAEWLSYYGSDETCLDIKNYFRDERSMNIN